MPTGAHYMQQPPPSHAHYPPPQQQQHSTQANPQDTMQHAQQQQQSQHMWPPNAGTGAVSVPVPGSVVVPTSAQQAAANGTALTLGLVSQLDAIKIQQNTLREQIKQSDANLSAQHTVNNVTIIRFLHRCDSFLFKHAYTNRYIYFAKQPKSNTS